MDSTAINRIENRCRLCSIDLLNADEVVVASIFDTVGLQDKIRKYLQITIKRDDYLPKIICGVCLKVLYDFDNLCIVARNTQKEFLLLLNPNSSSGKLVVESGGAVKQRRRRRKNYEIEEERDRKLILNGFQLEMAQKFGHNLYSDSDIKLGQIIRDTELLKLILKALKWNDDLEQLERLRNSDFRRILNNSSLLHNDDFFRLIRSYMGQDNNNNGHNHTHGLFGSGLFQLNYNRDESVTEEMEVKVDPSLFLPEEDELETTPMEDDSSRTLSIDLNEQMNYREEAAEEEDIDILLNPFQCTSCPQRFQTHVQLQDHVLTHLLNKEQSSTKNSSLIRRGRPRKKHIIEPNLKLAEKENEKMDCLKRKLNTTEERRQSSEQVTFNCSVCCKTFKKRNELRFHLSKQHHSGATFQCVFCPKVFASSGNCVSHRKRMHPDQK